ncbi:alpha-ketoglutarate-dependent dioxygenase AlkB [Arcticibacter sp. MXS-1]|uniref:alpha-ketoglutarate-dependent dioxygenase AlkB n=1 Tax=Arcticibacter sp. MXS-1 TaxID=3341726 RepID=UPI0035A91812
MQENRVEIGVFIQQAAAVAKLPGIVLATGRWAGTIRRKAQRRKLLVMNTLFPTEPTVPQGFFYTSGFITESEEDQLLKAIAETELHTFNFHGYEAKRKVASFGYDWSFESRELSKGRDIPPAFLFLVSRVAEFLKVKEEEVGELLVTEYPEGAVINWHRDAPPFDIIAGISLLADCSFRFRPYEKARQSRKSLISIPVSRRSLYVMKGESRSNWEHSISPVKHTRYSITLRTLRK